jgi:hypothetical protein
LYDINKLVCFRVLYRISWACADPLEITMVPKALASRVISARHSLVESNLNILCFAKVEANKVAEMSVSDIVRTVQIGRCGHPVMFKLSLRFLENIWVLLG